ncbi:major facilitator superfamily domain-containing protein [Podospora aff. communis PSN243]|uniref:Major facilitator superfamily domain-containing protein n=1 Tax=Podospora aff. communis PSN243 TaxID=3040156 RepID=A0AAV9H811_9PEZI|nr:major facilitator superfamily domain-containing protein [Podospora aff. communis PSN243]
MTSSLADLPNRGNPAGDESQKPSKVNRKRPAPLTGTSSRDQSAERTGGLRSGLDSNEHSPLLSPASNEDDGFLRGPAAADTVDDHQVTKSVWWLILLTIGIGGLQIAWSVEMSNGSPYLLSLGISKSVMALVWIAGPLSGTLVQPYVGMLSDNCRIPWGKRKPFMLGGTVATIVSLLFLAWTREIVGGFFGVLGVGSETTFVKYAIIVTAVLWVYILDFAINTVQASIRAFIVDCAPTHQQEAANAMASRFVGIGSITGYLAGYVKLSTYFWWLGSTQFQDLCGIASLILAATVVLSCLTIRERDPRLEGPPSRDQPGVLSFFRKIFTSIKRLPPQTKKVCQVQFCAWIGFFPMLFYTSAYIGELYAEPFLEENPNMTPEELDKLYETATQVGTFALLIWSITGLATNVFLPFFIAPTYDGPPVVDGNGQPLNVKDFEDDEKSWLDYLVIPGFTLRRAWMLGQILFTCSMLCTVFVRTVTTATILIGLVGITWAITLWAPWAIISAEISRREEARRLQRQHTIGPDGGPVASLNGYSSDENRERSLDSDDEADQAGVILGIHNMAIAAPQIIATLVSSIIFSFFQKPRNEPGDHSIAIVLALGGLMVFVSIFFIYSINDEPEVPVDSMSAIEDGEAITRPSTSHSRTRSFEQLPRASLERATLVRNKSFSGAEY